MDQSQEPRSPAAKELPSVLQFLNGELRPQSNWSISQEYPTVFQHSNLHNLKILTDQHEVIAHAGMKTFVVKTPLAMWKAAGLGNILTHPKHRNQGLSAKLIEACLVEAEQQSVDFVVLWSDLHDFYKKFGFELVGQEEHVVLPQNFSPSETLPPSGLTGSAGSSKLRFLETPKICAQALLKLYNEHSVGVVRTAEEIRKFLEIPNSKIWTAWDESNQLKAYAVLGKGLDLQGYIHEWGGKVSALTALISHISQQSKEPTRLISPATSVNLLSSLMRSGAKVQAGYLGLIKIIQKDTFLAKITRAAYSLKQDIKFRQSIDGSTILDYSKSGKLTYSKQFSSDQELARFVFGPTQWSSDDPKEIQEELSLFFPMPLWFWGWDSV